MDSLRETYVLQFWSRPILSPIDVVLIGTVDVNNNLDRTTDVVKYAA